MQTIRTWDIFCKVIDNFGDIGVCWRLCTQLAQRGQQVRLWVDDPSALAWMAPDGAAGVQVRLWTSETPSLDLDTPGDVVIEAFGCEVDAHWIAHNSIADYALSIKTKPIKRPLTWLNVEYLSAQGYVLRNHGLQSPVMTGPAQGMEKWFFYPGFTQGTGGLLRGADVDLRLASQDTHLQGLKLKDSRFASPHQLKISLFCYEPSALTSLVGSLAQSEQPVELKVTAGRAAQAVERVLNHKNALDPLWNKRKQLSIAYQALMTQSQYNDLLWSSDINFVRGEDSLVRALWAGKPLVWHIYPQSDGAHAAKLDAFLDWLEAPPDVRLFHRVWNELSTDPLPRVDWSNYARVVFSARQRLLGQRDLVSQLIDFVARVGN